MSQSVYELIALAARYVFAGLMLLIVARAWRITIVDSRRAATLRRTRQRLRAYLTKEGFLQ